MADPNIVAFVGGLCGLAGAVIGTFITGKVQNRKISVDEATSLRTEYREEIKYLRIRVDEISSKSDECEKREIQRERMIAKLEDRVEQLEQITKDARSKLKALIGLSPAVTEILTDLEEAALAQAHAALIGVVETPVPTEPVGPQEIG